MALSPLKSPVSGSFGRRRSKFPTPAVLLILAGVAVFMLARMLFSTSSDLRAGRKAWEQGQYDLAQAKFQKVLAKDPENAAAYDGLGMVENSLGNQSQAARDYQKAMELGLKSGKAFDHEKVGASFIQKGRYQPALLEFRHALELKPESAEAHLGLAECLHANASFAEAISQYQQALAARPNWPAAKQGLDRATQAKERGTYFYIYDRNEQPLARQSLNPDGTWTKSYPLEQFAAHVIGVDNEKMGKTGLEKSLQSLFPGNEVVLTIDARIQKLADNALGWKKGSVVVVDPATGEILAAVNHPSFNPEQVSKHYGQYKNNPNQPLKNRAFDGQYEPGSIVKVITAAAALETHTDMNAIFPVMANGSIMLDGKAFWDWKNHGKVHSLKEALDVSSNIAMAKVGFALGADRLYEYTSRFGFGIPDDMGFDIPGQGHIPIEAARSAAPLSADNRFALAERACGLGETYRITPLHAAFLAATVANHGVMMKPMLVKEVRNVVGDVIVSNQPAVARKAIEPETAAKLTEYMIDTTEKGIGKKARVSGIEVAGKTGTARTTRKGLDAWFICFAPADKPQIAVAVLAEAEGTGMDVAAPIARQLIQDVVK